MEWYLPQGIGDWSDTSIMQMQDREGGEEAKFHRRARM